MKASDHVADMAKEAAGNWKKFQSFGWHAQPDDADDWAIVYTSNRDSGLVEQSNAAAIAERMRPFCEDRGGPLEPDAREESHNHWAVGHVDGYAIRVYCQATRLCGAAAQRHGVRTSYPDAPRESGYQETAWEPGRVHVYRDWLLTHGFDPDEDDREVTPAFAEWVQISLALESYPLLDDEDYSRREYEATLANIEDAGSRWTHDDVPEDWAAQCFSWFWEHNQGAVESRGDQGGYPSDKAMQECLRALGFHEDCPEEEDPT